jgi:thioesterase domain-containing protein/acyl carrier protein
LHDLGCDHVFHSRDTSYAANILSVTGNTGVDVVLNSLSGNDKEGHSFVEMTLKSAGKNARWAEIGKAGVWSNEQVAAAREDVSYTMFDLLEVTEQSPELIHSMFASICADLENGLLKPLHMHVFEKEKLQDAFRFMAQAKHRGKVVVRQKVAFVQWNRTGAYLITGGFGGLGMRLAEWMVERGVSHVVLAGRKGCPASAEAFVKKLEARGATVTCVKMDASKAEDVTTAFKTVANIKGIVHAAGVLDDKKLSEMDVATFEKVMKPKIDGAWNLHQASLKLDLDMFVLFSSISSVTGNMGQSNYAVANAYLDGLAALRKTMDLPAIAINWGAWGEVGMAADLDTSALGMAKIVPEEGLKMMEQCIVCAENANVVVAPLRAFVKQLGASVPSILSALVSADTSGAGGASEVVAVLKKLKEGERLAYLVGDMATKVKGMLGLPDGFELDGTQALPALGLDSLMVMELRNVVKQDTGVLLQPDALLNFPTLDGLSGVILSELSLGGSSGASAGPKTVVELTPMVAGSSVAPFFCVQGAGRGDFLYAEIAKQLGSKQPFYELRGIGYDFKEVADLATHFCDEIEKICPEGPVQVGGWSFGGCVAYEIVQQLIARGRNVSRLVLIDWVEKGMAGAAYDPQHAAFGALVRSVELMAGTKLPVMDAAATTAFRALDFDGKFDTIVNQLVAGGMLPSSVDRDDLASVIRGFEHAIAALLRHDAPPMAGFTGCDVLSVRATKFGFPDMTEYDWAAVAAKNDRVTSHSIDCDHWEILRKPCVESLGGFVGDFLGKK